MTKSRFGSSFIHQRKQPRRVLVLHTNLIYRHDAFAWSYHPLTYVTSMNPRNPNFANEVAASFAQQSIMHLIGASLTLIEPGVVEITLPYRQDLTQQNGYLHAGIVTTIADSACGYAAFTLMPEGSGVLSVEFKVNLLRPAKGEYFLARAEVIKAGKTLTVVRSDVFALTEDKRTLIATMQGTMMCIVSEARP